ncbi:alkene reductase [uncultured Vibrio sp.]|uniref:alkene reductase n=1 Tax=uncultured Vibrio sp. TaxID=114054 RepID=UPI002AA93421|nr:alkene reductase [uncultured Vibrio sp.]
MSKLFTALSLSGLPLTNRIAMAPMTRSRAQNGVADEMTAEYYAQRASAGLLISEGTPVSRQGNGYLFTPGIYSQEQIDGWSKVTRAVHNKGGRIFAQLWHVGRVSHTSIQPEGSSPVSSVSIQGGTAFGYDANGNPDRLPASEPIALSEQGIEEIIDDFRAAAANAIAAGFDGVEIHAANGYLFEQFLNSSLNNRTDAYGGKSVENRARFLLETLDAVIDEIGEERTGVRLSPFHRGQEMPAQSDTEVTYLFVAKAMEERNCAYLHLSLEHETLSSGLLPKIRRTYKGVLIAAGGLNKDNAEVLLNDNLIDMAALGTPFIANPDLVERLKNDWPLAEFTREAFYGGGEAGYTDFPNFQG